MSIVEFVWLDRKRRVPGISTIVPNHATCICLSMSPFEASHPLVIPQFAILSIFQVSFNIQNFNGWTIVEPQLLNLNVGLTPQKRGSNDVKWLHRLHHPGSKMVQNGPNNNCDIVEVNLGKHCDTMERLGHIYIIHHYPTSGKSPKSTFQHWIGAQKHPKDCQRWMRKLWI